MSWHFIIIIQIIVSVFLALYTRQASLAIKKVFFGVGALSYIAIACAGWLYAVVLTPEQIHLPNADMWPFLLLQGMCISGAWLLQYQLIRYIGASNAALTKTLGTVFIVCLGIIFLQESLTPSLLFGGLCIITGTVVALRIQQNTAHTTPASTLKKSILVVSGSALFAVGMLAEKIAIDHVGHVSYMGFGWSLQAAGAIGLFILFGRKELRHITRPVIRKSLLLGGLTSVAGGLYVYALSLGSLSFTTVATSSKIALIMVLSAIFFHERNAWQYRVLAFALTCGGLLFLLM